MPGDVLWSVERFLDRFVAGRPPWTGGDGDANDPRGQLAALWRRHDASAEAGRARAAKLESLGSRGAFFGGLVRIADVVRPAMVVATPTEFVLLDADEEANPTGELGRIAKADVKAVRLVDGNGNDVADGSIDPVRELDTPGDDTYGVVLERADGSSASVSFMFLSGEPALFARDRFRDHLARADGAAG